MARHSKLAENLSPNEIQPEQLSFFLSAVAENTVCP
jgi:hypothetical protein